MAVYVGVKWYQGQIRKLVTTIPQQSHRVAAAGAAKAAAGEIHSTYTGTLARAVSKPRPETPLSSLIGTDQVAYAAIEHFGGTITPKRSPRLLIHGRAVGSKGKLLRSTARGRRGGFGPYEPGQGPGTKPVISSASGVVASATSVSHKGKKYLQKAIDVYPDLVAQTFRQLMGAA